MSHISTLICKLDLINRPMRHNVDVSPDDRLNACVLAAAKEAIAASGHGRATGGHVTWLGDGWLADARLFLFVVSTWVGELPVALHVTGEEYEVMFFFDQTFKDDFPPSA